MKRTVIVLALLFFTNLWIVNAQTGCVSGSSIRVLDANNVKAVLPNNGSLWSDNVNGGGYIFPNDNGVVEVSTFFKGGLWFGGVDPTGNLKLSATTYEPITYPSPYTPGPLNPNTGTTDIETCIFWDTHFQTKQSDIESFLQDWSDGSLDDDIPSSILGWPARGNPFFMDIYGFELPDTGQGLAPFWDENADGIYNPEDGDYPFIKDATQAIWWVFNNSNSATTFPALSPQLEIQMMAYAYDSPVESVNNSTFYDVKYINRGMETLDSAFVSLWMDPSLGCFLDDYIGCVPEENMAFIYNSDAVDGDVGCSCQGVPTYCQQPPIIGMKILKGPLAERLVNENGETTIPPIGVSGDTIVEMGLSSFSYYLNSATGQVPPQQSDPATAIEYYNYMNGRFRDNAPMLTNNGQVTPFGFSGNPANSEEWSMCSESIDVENTEFRALMNMGSFRMLPGAVNEFTFCVTGVENVEHPCPDINILTDAMNEVQDLWEGNNIPVSTKPIVNSVELRVFPNPMKTTTQIALDDENDLIETIEIFNVNGQSILLKKGLSNQNVIIDRKQLQAGIYFYTVLTKNQKIFSGKISLL